MKIVFVGGGTGGHFYPLISVAEEIGKYAIKNQLIQPKLYYFGPNKYDEKALYNSGLRFVRSFAGKMRRTKDIQSHILNFFSIFPIMLGIFKSLFSLFLIFPDVVFSKGGYTSIPVVFAARILRIPIVIHESDASFGRANLYAKKFAKYIAISYPEAEESLSKNEKERSALIGVPLRKALLYNPLDNAHQILKLKKDIPIIIVLGGSLGSKFINQNIIDSLPKMLKEYQVVHIVGKDKYKAVKKETDSFLRGISGLNTYHPIEFVNAYNLRALYSVASVAISRAGSGTLFELAEWGIPSIIIPIRTEISHDQRKNAYAYSRSGGGIVLEEENLNPSLLLDQVRILIKDEKERNIRIEKAKSFAKPEAGRKLAELLVSILKSHEV